MNDITHITERSKELDHAIKVIQQPRTDFELKHFVVGQHDTEPRRWAQCVLELQIKIQTLRRAEILRRQMRRKIKKLERKGTRNAIDQAELLRIDLEDHSLAVLGATREARALLAIYKSFSRTYSRKELNDSERDYWERRLNRQALQDATANGRVGVANQDALRMLAEQAEPPDGRLVEIERRFLGVGSAKLLVAVPTLIDRDMIRRDGMRCLHGWSIPGTFEQRICVVQGRPTADAYNIAAATAVADGADFMLCVEDDHIVPSGTFEKIWATYRTVGSRSIVGAWYSQRTNPRAGSAIVITEGRRAFLDDDGAVHEVYGITQGFTLIPTLVFRDIEPPWFVSTGALTQDSYFSQLARDAGYKLLIDTAARIKHVCRATGRVYE